MNKLKPHLLGFLFFLIMWIVGGSIIDIILSFAFGDTLSRFTGFIGFVLGIYMWYLMVKTSKEKRDVAS